MELFPLFVNIIAIIAVIGGLSIGGWWVWTTFNAHSRKAEKELPITRLPDELHEVMTGVPASLVAFYIFVVVIMIAYVLYIWLGDITY